MTDDPLKIDPRRIEFYHMADGTPATAEEAMLPGVAHWLPNLTAGEVRELQRRRAALLAPDPYVASHTELPDASFSLYLGSPAPADLPDWWKDGRVRPLGVDTLAGRLPIIVVADHSIGSYPAPQRHDFGLLRRLWCWLRGKPGYEYR